MILEPELDGGRVIAVTWSGLRGFAKGRGSVEKEDCEGWMVKDDRWGKRGGMGRGDVRDLQLQRFSDREVGSG